MNWPLGISTSFMPMLLVISLGGWALEILAPTPSQSDTAITPLHIDWNMMYLL
jgi:hypothetical protein